MYDLGCSWICTFAPGDVWCEIGRARRRNTDIYKGMLLPGDDVKHSRNPRRRTPSSPGMSYSGGPVPVTPIPLFPCTWC